MTLKTVDNGKTNFPKVTCFGVIGEAAAKLVPDEYYNSIEKLGVALLNDNQMIL